MPSIQTSQIMAKEDAKISSPTKSVSIDAAANLRLSSLGGNLEAFALDNITMSGSEVRRMFLLYLTHKCHMYSMPQRVGHASLGNLEVLHQKANCSTIVFTHCEQENEII